MSHITETLPADTHPKDQGHTSQKQYHQIHTPKPKVTHHRNTTIKYTPQRPRSHITETPPADAHPKDLGYSSQKQYHQIHTPKTKVTHHRDATAKFKVTHHEQVVYHCVQILKESLFLHFEGMLLSIWVWLMRRVNGVQSRWHIIEPVLSHDFSLVWSRSVTPRADPDCSNYRRIRPPLHRDF